MSVIANPTHALLCDLGVCTEDSIEPFYPRVRDREDVAVLRCRRSGVVLLSRADHVDRAHYENVESFAYWSATDRSAAIGATRDDDQRRARQFEARVSGRKWLDVGTGAGGLLDLLAPIARDTAAIEPQAAARAALTTAGYRVYPSAADVPDRGYETVTLFHVLEHLTEPIETLERLRGLMAPGGVVIVEVPHARDVLMTLFDVEAFKAFTFWSEHLILHTRDSLHATLARSGFSNIAIGGYQRYPLANHLHWLAKGRPGGHEVWAALSSEDLDAAYASMLARIDATDTLIAVAEC